MPIIDASRTRIDADEAVMHAVVPPGFKSAEVIAPAHTYWNTSCVLRTTEEKLACVDVLPR